MGLRADMKAASMKREDVRIEGRHVLFGMIAFFGVIIGVNITLAVFANTSWTGLSVENGYVASQHFNADLAEARRQAALGWKAEFGYRDTQLELVLADGHGHPLSGFMVEVELERPSTDRDDHRLTLVESRPGIYAVAGSLKSGQWDADVRIRDGTGRSMRRIYRFVVADRS
jgi:nitrogen fixation protein FixH